MFLKLKQILLAMVLGMAAQPVMAQDPDSGQELFRSYCATCHGLDGRGDGPMARVLIVKPGDLTKLTIGNSGVFPLIRVVRQIDGRDPMLAHGGEMPLFGEFFEGEDAALKTPSGQPVLTSKAIVDLIVWLKDIQY